MSLCFLDPICWMRTNALTSIIRIHNRLRMRDGHFLLADCSGYVVTTMFLELYLALPESQSDASSAPKLVLMIGFHRSRLVVSYSVFYAANVDAIHSWKKEKSEASNWSDTRLFSIVSSVLRMVCSHPTFFNMHQLLYTALNALHTIKTMDMKTHRWARRQPLAKSPSPVHSPLEHTFVTETGSTQTPVQAYEGTGKQALIRKGFRGVWRKYTKHAKALWGHGNQVLQNYSCTDGVEFPSVMHLTERQMQCQNWLETQQGLEELLAHRLPINHADLHMQHFLDGSPGPTLQVWFVVTAPNSASLAGPLGQCLHHNNDHNPPEYLLYPCPRFQIHAQKEQDQYSHYYYTQKKNADQAMV